MYFETNSRPERPYNWTTGDSGRGGKTSSAERKVHLENESTVASAEGNAKKTKEKIQT